MQNEYGSLLEGWKVKLVVIRARMKGFRWDEIDDAQQEIIPVMLEFKYDQARANGATELTVLTSLVDRRLSHLQRGVGRRRKNEEKYCLSYAASVRDEVVEDQLPGLDRSFSMAIDVQESVDRLQERERAICGDLASGKRPSQIAREMGLSRYSVDQIIERLRESFRLRGLDTVEGN